MPSPIRVLYVDDYPLDRELVRDALELEHGGFAVTMTASRREFEARLTPGACDVVLSDFNILGFDGLAVLDAVRAVDPAVPVVIVTGTGSEEVAAEAIKRGAADYVIKTPWQIRQLPRVIHEALEKRRLREEHERAEIELRRRNEDLALLNTINAAVNRGESLGALVNLISQETTRLFDSFGATLHLLDPERRRLVIQNQTLPPALVKGIERMLGISIPPIAHDLQTAHPYRQVLESGKPQIISGLAGIQEFTAGYLLAVQLSDQVRGRIKRLIPAIIKLLGYQYLLIVPLQAGSEVIGTLDMGRRQPFTGEDARRLEIIAGQITAVILRQRAEEARRESEEKYRNVVERANDGIVIVQDGAVKFVNSRLAEWWGGAVDDIVGAPFTHYLHPDEAAQVVDRYRRRVAGEVVSAIYETVLKSKQGNKVYAEINAGLISYQGRPADLVIVRDITARKQMEEVEREQRALAEALRETAAALASTLSFDEVLDRILLEVGRVVPHDGSAIMLIEGNDARIVRSQGHAARGYGDWIAKVSFLVAQTPNLKLMAETGRPLAIPHTANDADWLQFPEEQWVRSNAGAPIKVKERVIGFISLNSARPGFFTQAHAERLQAFADQAGVALENARLLAETQRRARELTALYETALAVSSVLDTNALLAGLHERVHRLIAHDGFMIAFCDPGAAEYEIALAVEEGRNLPELAGVRSRLIAGGLTGWVLNNRQTLLIADLEDGTTPTQPIVDGRPARAWLGVPLVAHNRLIGAVSVQAFHPHAFSEDDRRLLEALAAPVAIALDNARLYDEIRRHAAELEQRVATRTAELTQREAALRAANEQLERLSRIKSEFVSNVSHELRTPLTNIKSYLWLLEKGKPEKRGQYMETLYRESDLLHRLIEDLLHLSRLDLGKVKPALAPVDVNQMVTLLAGDRALLFADRGLRLEARSEPDLPVIQADQKMLIQVLTNLMTNAMNYTPAGGVVTVSTGLRHRDWGLGIEDHPQSPIPNPSTWVTFSVADTGPGISVEDQPRLFERFYRGEAAHQTQAPGTGLGLAISQELVERHGGKITVASQVGQGSTFTVWLPVNR